MKEIKEKAIRSLQKLLTINSVKATEAPNAPFGEGTVKALEFVLGLAKELGAKTKNVDGYAGWADFGEGSLFGVLCHLDVVPASGNWEFDPFGGIIKNNILYGRGDVDNKGPATACLYAYASLLEEGFKPKKRTRFIFGLDEESGWKCMKRYAETEEIPEIGFSPDANFPVIYSEKGVLHLSFRIKKPTSISKLFGGTKINMVPDFCTCELAYSKEILSKALALGLPTSLSGYDMLSSLALELEEDHSKTKENMAAEDYLTISANGTSAHGSTPNEGDNAILKLLSCIAADEEYLELSQVYKAFLQTDGAGAGMQVKSETGDLTISLNTVKTLEKEIEFGCDIRYPVTTNREAILTAIGNTLPFITLLIINDRKEPLYINPNSDLVQNLLSAYNSVMGTHSVPQSIGGATFARFLPYGVAFGPVFPGTKNVVHMENENVPVKDFNKWIDIYKEAFKRLVF